MALENVLPNDVSSTIFNYSFIRYLDSCIDRFPPIDLNDRQHVIRVCGRINPGNLWDECIGFVKKYFHESDVKEFTTKLKANVLDITGITEQSRLEFASLVVLDLFIRNETSTQRIEDMQNLFAVKNIKIIPKTFIVIDELIQEISRSEYENFTRRWCDLYTIRIRSIQNQFLPVLQNASKDYTEVEDLIINDSMKLYHCFRSPYFENRLKTLSEMQFLEQLDRNQNVFNVTLTSAMRENLTKVVVSIIHNDSDDRHNMQICEKFILLSTAPVQALSSSIDRNTVSQMFSDRFLHLMRAKSKKRHRKDIRTRHTDSNGRSLISLQEIDNHSFKTFGKHWIEKQLRSKLNHLALESVNIRFVILFLTELLCSELGNEDIERKLLDLFGYGHIDLVNSFIEKRDLIQNHCASCHKRKHAEVIYIDEVEKLKHILDSEFNESPKMCNSTCTFRSSDHRVSSTKTENPHIFDSFVANKMISAFVSSGKILLPEHHIRKDTNTFEEIHIPIKIDTSLDESFQYEPVSISSLDNIGQIVFSDLRTLNPVQSTVFPAAYHSNENILVCAPTGSGKTNVALLTIVREIRNNIEMGVVKKDKFKIVYVAPMKALASEMTANFSKKLKSINICVRELTGDMQLTKAEIAATQILVTTPEKWDLVTRKGDGDATLSSLVKLLIIDEVHLLHSDRGPVIEALVARTLRQVENSQKMIRIVGLSATLPNYKDVATFLRVNPQTGLYFFDSRFRPVPLAQSFIGVKSQKMAQQICEMNQVCYDKVVRAVQNNMQAMVFVHARMNTVKTALALKEIASQRNQLGQFEVKGKSNAADAAKLFNRAHSKQLSDLLLSGFAIHHAGLLRHDRSLVEDCFAKGYIKVLVCTSTLAWGVNLPAHTVVIKGTEMYDAKNGSFVDLGILDVLQIFGRAGRPQFNECGYGVIITAHNKLHHYLSLMMNQFPIESRFISYLADNLNAEISLGTITSIDEAIEWLSYTYLFIRMKINPQEYGINYSDVEFDSTLFAKRKDLIVHTAKVLDKLRMIRYSCETGKLSPTDLGRTASLFYVKYDTIEIFSSLLKDVMNEPETLSMLSQAHEFEQLKIRDEEMDELDTIEHDYCEYNPVGGSANVHGKVNILMQAYLSRARLRSFSLISDISYIAQNASRIMRALFDIVLRRNNALLAGRFLTICQMFEQQQWYFETPLRQFKVIPEDILDKIDQRNINVYDFKEMDGKEIGVLLRNSKMGNLIKKCAEEFPSLHLSTTVQPITSSVLRVRLDIKTEFKWNDRFHGKSSEPFWVWVEDPDTNFLYHSEYFFLSKKQVLHEDVQQLIFTLPVHDPLPSQYVVRVSSDRWLGAVTQTSIPFNNIILPELHPVQTELLPLQPLPITALNCPAFEQLFKFSHFNPIQTQIFYCLYHTDNNVLVGAPTGSGKTIIAEIAFFRAFRINPFAKVVYVAPLKALVKERIRDWSIKFGKNLGKKVVELTGDVTPDRQAISSASIIVTTPEKWDSISRCWTTRNYVKKVVLIVIDEIHLLGEDRGPVLEIIVSRTNFISSHTGVSIRIIGLSTAVANADDLASWLRIDEIGLYNFRPSVRPVPLEVHICTFPGKHYCPRMASMNKPAFQAIKQYSPAQPVLVFVSSRRQTRLTAMDLLAQLASENNPKQWLRMQDLKMNQILDTIKDDNLKVLLAFGIGLHHAGLQESDRKIVEELFERQQIQVLIATSTLAWGVNFPAHLVIIKGTEYYDCKSHRYVDMPITDILQMMGRAGRPQFDKQGVAVVMVHDVKKNFYKRFLYEPFPVESHLLHVLPDHLNAEIVSGSVKTCQNAIDYLTWTYFFRRLLRNPVFYERDRIINSDNVGEYLSNLITSAVATLEGSCLLTVDSDGKTLLPTTLGRIASFYYISHQTMFHFSQSLKPDLNIPDLLYILSRAHEYADVPVRHNEELINAELAKLCKLKVTSGFDCPHTKTHLLFQAHFSRLVLPCTDYQTDLKTVLDNGIRILQAMIDVCGEYGWLASTLRAQQLLQMVIQGRWITDNPLMTLPNIEAHHVQLFLKDGKLITLPALCSRVHTANNYGPLLNLLQEHFVEHDIDKIHKVLYNMPRIKVNLSIVQFSAEDDTKDTNVAPLKFSIKPNIINMLGSPNEYVFNVEMVEVDGNENHQVHAPMFPKAKEGCWFLTIGSIEDKELISMKRIVFGRKKKMFFNFNLTLSPGITVINIYLLSDSYIGLDQQFNIQLSTS